MNKIHSGQLFTKESAARYFSVYEASGGLSQQEAGSRKRTSVGTRVEQKSKPRAEKQEIRAFPAKTAPWE